MAEAARSEMHADPEAAVGAIFEEVDVVIARSDRAELLARQVEQFALRLDGTFRDGVDHRMIDTLVVAAPDAEGQRLPERVHDARGVDVGRLDRKSVV